MTRYEAIIAEIERRTVACGLRRPNTAPNRINAAVRVELEALGRFCRSLPPEPAPDPDTLAAASIARLERENARLFEMLEAAERGADLGRLREAVAAYEENVGDPDSDALALGAVYVAARALVSQPAVGEAHLHPIAIAERVRIAVRRELRGKYPIPGETP